MRYIFIFLLIGTLQAQNLHQVNVPTAIGGSPHASSLLTLTSTDKGFLIPRMTTAQKNAIPTPATGLMVYDTDLNQVHIFNGTWGSLGGGSSVAGSNGEIQFNNNGALGASSNLFWDNANGRLGIGTSTPSSLFHVMSGSQSVIQATSDNRITIGNATNLSNGNFIVVNHGLLGTSMQFLNNRIAILTSNTSFPGNNKIDHATGNFGINVDPTAKLHVKGTATTNGTDALLVEASDGRDLFEVENGGRIAIGKDLSGTTQATATIRVNPGETDANIGIALVPKGTGAITVNVPDGTIAGGNARGVSSVDLQLHRDGANKVASGTRATITGGSGNRASANLSFVGGGLNNFADGLGYSTISGGLTNTISDSYGNTIAGGSSNLIAIGGYSSIGGGSGNRVETSFSTISGGAYARTTLYGQRAQASGQFAITGIVSDNQTSDIRFRNLATGNAQVELFLDGASAQAVLSLTGTTNARVWNARIQCVAIVTAQGNGTVTAGSTHSETYDIVIKRTSAGTVIVGSSPLGVIRVSEMSSAFFTVDADTTNNALRIRFTPPSTAGSTTTIRAVATAYLTELGY